jgi:hypothetical protein
VKPSAHDEKTTIYPPAAAGAANSFIHGQDVKVFSHPSDQDTAGTFDGAIPRSGLSGKIAWSHAEGKK